MAVKAKRRIFRLERHSGEWRQYDEVILQPRSTKMLPVPSRIDDDEDLESQEGQWAAVEAQFLIERINLELRESTDADHPNHDHPEEKPQ